MVYKMEHIKIENPWGLMELDYKNKECDCSFCEQSCSPIITDCECCNNVHRMCRCLHNCGSKSFTKKLYAVKYPNMIITNMDGHLHIFDTIQNKVIFSSKNILNEENKELIRRLHKLDQNKNRTSQINENARFMYNSTMMMEHFMIIKFKNSCYDRYGNRYIDDNIYINYTLIGANKHIGYVIFNFKTQTYKSLMFCTLYICNDILLFRFVEENMYKIITKSDIDNNINNIMEIDFCKTIEGYGKDGINMCCMCNSSIIIFRLTKKVADKYFSKYIYYDIKKQKNVYTSKNQFIGWRGNRFIEYDEELKKCNLISFISDDIQQIPVKNNTPKKIINCIRCLDKFEESDEVTIPEHKNVCSLCIIKL